MVVKTSRFGQAEFVDRLRPHIFHRDYWHLKGLKDGVAHFIQHANLRGKLLLDYGAGVSPYAKLVEDVGATLIRADIGNSDPNVVEIAMDGRVALEDQSIDAILSTQVLEHVPDVQVYLREAMRVLRPGGQIFLTTHGAWILHRVPTDFRRWTVDGLRYELERAGFTITDVKFATSMLAFSTHLRAIIFGGVLRRTPFLKWLAPALYLGFNVRMWIEETLTPVSMRETHPELILITAAKPA